MSVGFACATQSVVDMCTGASACNSVTWVAGEPTVEGVAADDYEESRALISLLRMLNGKAHARTEADIPRGYEAFRTVKHRDEIAAPYSPNSMAVKIVEDDLVAWSTHALMRASSRAGALPTSTRATPQPAVSVAPTPALEHVSDSVRGGIITELLRFGETLTQTDLDKPPKFTDNPQADALVCDDPFAFLLAVLFDQGIPAERAWGGPYLLKQRLGHLEPRRMMEDPANLDEAVNRRDPRALHRYVNTMPIWIVAAAHRVLEECGGDAEGIWADQPTAVELQRRLRRFVGIGQKKAAMAVEILARDLHRPIRALEGGDIAFDVHVRRVFLRTGLADRDDLEHMLAVARAANPIRPGAIDMPAWVIGRTWCQAGIPACAACRLSAVCPKLVSRAANVLGA